MIKRIKSGIPGFDGLIGGGLVLGSVSLLTGETGTGKTTFCSQFMWHGLQKGETGVYITLEEDVKDIKEDVKQFGWDFDQFEKKNMLRIIYHDPAQINNIGSVIIKEVTEIKASRIVLDSTSVMALNIENPAQIRRRLYGIINALKTHDGTTALVVTEIPEGTKSLSRFGVEEFVTDGVIVLNYLGLSGDYNRSITIRKMRRTNHGKDIYPFEINSKGIHIRRSEL